MKADLLQTYKAAKESRGLKEWDDIKRLSNNDLLAFFLDFTFVINRKEGEVHFYMLMASYYISGLFQEMWPTMFGVEPGIDPNYHRLMSGFEAADIVFTRGLWQLGRKAVDAGSWSVFVKTDRRSCSTRSGRATPAENGPGNTMSISSSTGGEPIACMPTITPYGLKNRA